MTPVLLMIGRLLRRGWAGLFGVLLALVLFELVQAPVAASFGGAGGMQAILDRLPPTLQALARVRPEFIAISGLAGYLSVGFTHPLYVTLAAAALIGFAARSLAGEMERGTIQIALARPVSRARVYGARVIGLFVVVVALAAAGPLGLWAGVVIARPAGELEAGNLLTVAAASGLLFWAIGGLALLGSAAASTTGRVIGWAIAVLIVAYFVDYFAAIWSILEPVEFLSLFDYFDPAQALVNGRLPLQNVATLGIVGTVGVVAGLIVFQRRDLPT